MKKEHYETIFLSDIHLGTKDSKAEEAIEFLKACRCRRLVLNGDIVDGWALKRGGTWTDAHTKLVRTVLKKMEKEGTEIIYLRGNHDDILERFLPISFGRMRIEQEYVHQTPQGDYLVVHGDGFDAVTTNYKWVALLGSLGYYLLLRINRFYNRWRSWRGKDYYSLSKEIKGRVKSAVSFVGRYEEQLQSLAESRDCVGIICGHIHSVADKKVGEIHYLNSGDWVESMTAIVEPKNGEFEVIHYDDWKRRRETAKAEKAQEKEAREAEEEAAAEKKVVALASTVEAA